MKNGFLSAVAAIVTLLFFWIAPVTLNPLVPNDVTTAYYASYGRNLVRYSISVTRGMNLNAVGEGQPKALLSPSGAFTFYIDHPMMITWLAAVALKLSSGSLLAARSVSILSSVALLILVGIWARQQLGIRAAIAGMTAVALTRVFWIHGVILNFEPLTALFCLASLVFFADVFFDSIRPRKTSMVLGYLFWVLGMLTDWPAYFIGLPLAWQLARKRQWCAMLGSLLLSVSFYAAIMTYYGIQIGDPWLAIHFGFGTFHDEMYVHGSSWIEVAVNVIKNGAYNFGSMPAFAVAGIYLAWKQKGRRSTAGLFILLSVSCIGVLNILAFRQWAHDHTFWSYYFLPAIGLGAAEVAATFKFEVPRWQTELFGVGMILGVLNLIPVPRNLQIGVPFRMELPWQSDVHLLTRSDAPYYGQGYTARWYLDRPLTDANAVASRQIPCHAQNALFVMSEDEWERSSSALKNLFFPVEAFHWMVLPVAKAMKTDGVSCEEAVRVVVKPSDSSHLGRNPVIRQ